MAEAFYRLKSAGGKWTRVTGSAPITVSGLNDGEVYEYIKGDGTIGEVTAGAAIPLTLSNVAISGSELSLEVSRDADVYRTYTSSATSPTPARVIAGQDHLGVAADLATGPDAVAFGATATFSDDISSLADGTWYVHVAAKASDGVTSTVSTVSFVKNTALPVVSSYTGATKTTGVVIGGKTYDLYDALDDFSLTFSTGGVVELLLVGRGGSGGNRIGGGGSAGGFLERLISGVGGVTVTGTSYSGVIGDSGNSGDTTFAGLTARAGAVGGTYLGSAAGDGPSGGGASGVGGAPGSATAGADMGYDGGPENVNTNRGGGGGGAGGPGLQGAPNLGGRGGEGKVTNITGSALKLAAGGGAGGNDGAGGDGGGGNGADNYGTPAATQGTDGSGSGGGGGGPTNRSGARGGSGRAIIRVRTA